MSVDKITTTPTPLALVDKINELVGDYLPSDAKAALAALADKATADASGNTITSTYATKAQAITGLSASGTTVTYTKGDGSTGTITTQDTDTKYTLPTASSSTLGGIKVGSGLSISSGVLSASGGTISASSLGTNGYVKFSNGLILQWGQGSTTSDTYFTFNFPIAFTSATSYQVATGYLSAGDTQYGIGVHSKTSSSCRIYLNDNTANVICVGY